jgi:hypothetical protein
MAIKTFTDNTSLPASDINTFIANSGLVFVKSQTVGTTVSSVAVTGAFSAEYVSYKIIWNGGFGSTNQDLKLQLGASTTGYYGSLIYGAYAAAGAQAAGDNNQAAWNWAGTFATTGGHLEVTLHNPFLALETRIAGDAYVAVGQAGRVTGLHSPQVSYTGFTILPAGGTITGGTVTVYGYRKE